MMLDESATVERNPEDIPLCLCITSRVRVKPERGVGDIKVVAQEVGEPILTGITDPVPVHIHLIIVRHPRAVVELVEESVAINVFIASVADAISVFVLLIAVGGSWAIIAG